MMHIFKEKFMRHMLPFNYAIGSPHDTYLIINTMQLEIKKCISHPLSNGNLPSREAIIFNSLTAIDARERQIFYELL